MGALSIPQWAPTSASGAPQPLNLKIGTFLHTAILWNPKASGVQRTEHGFFVTAIYDVVIHLTVLHFAWLAPGF